jgi:hypothetical protein
MTRYLGVALCTPLLLVTGCAGTAGSANYACPGYPGQPLCLPTTEIYRLSMGDAPPPAAAPRPRLIRQEYPPAAGSGWVWSEEIYQ